MQSEHKDLDLLVLKERKGIEKLTKENDSEDDDIRRDEESNGCQYGPIVNECWTYAAIIIPIISRNAAAV